MIIKNANEVKEVTFNELNIGDSFIYNDCAFVKIKEITAIEDYGLEDIYNALCLSNGKLNYFFYSVKVSIPKIEVIITK